MDTKSASIVGVILVGVISLGLALWYMSGTPAPHTDVPTAIKPANTTPGETKHSLDETAPYYEIKAVYPASTPLKTSASAQADAQAVEVMKQFELNVISAFKEQGNFANLTHEDVKMMRLDERKETLDITYESKTSPKTVSYVYTMYQDTLGAHPNGFFRTFTFRSATGEGVDIGDVFTPGTNYLEKLSVISRKKLQTILAEHENVSVNEVDVKYIASGTTPDADNFQNWYLEGTNLVLIFPAYQVAPYVDGFQTVKIPFSELGTSLNPTYR